MLIGNEVDDSLVQYALGVGVVAVLLGYGVLHFLRKRRARRREPEIDFPDFLSGAPDPGDHAGRSGEVDWLEIHPLPRKIR